ncbi:MAG: SAM-dependent methyltransferase [Streptosporangiaceae bacterium]
MVAVERLAGVLAGQRGGRAAQRGRYGIDGGFAGLAVSGVLEAGLAGTVAWAVRDRRPAVAALAGAGGAVVAGSAASYLYCTGPGKRAIWAQLLDELGLRGDEHVLDVGCGRGAVLMLAARRLPAGRAVGADVWRRRDQSADRYAAVLRDAGCTDVAVRQLDWRTWYGIPGHHFPLVAATRPPG